MQWLLTSLPLQSCRRSARKHKHRLNFSTIQTFQLFNLWVLTSCLLGVVSYNCHVCHPFYPILRTCPSYVNTKDIAGQSARNRRSYLALCSSYDLCAMHICICDIYPFGQMAKFWWARQRLVGGHHISGGSHCARVMTLLIWVGGTTCTCWSGWRAP